MVATGRGPRQEASARTPAGRDRRGLPVGEVLPDQDDDVGVAGLVAARAVERRGALDAEVLRDVLGHDPCLPLAYITTDWAAAGAASGGLVTLPTVAALGGELRGRSTSAAAPGDAAAR